MAGPGRGGQRDGESRDFASAFPVDQEGGVALEQHGVAGRLPPGSRVHPVGFIRLLLHGEGARFADGYI